MMTKKTRLNLTTQLKTFEVTEDGEVYREGKRVKTHFCTQGWEVFRYKHSTIRVHRLVAFKYCENKLGHKTVDHIDGNKLNNHYTNLEWVSHSENAIRSWKNGLARPRKGSQHGRSILDEMQVLTILTLPYSKNGISSPHSNVNLAKHYGVSATRISSIRNLKEWKTITSLFNDSELKRI